MSITNYPEPEWCLTQYAFEECSSLSSSGPTPFIMTGVLKRLLQYHFSDPNNIQKPQLKGYIWTDSSAGCLAADDLVPIEGGGTGAEDGSRIYIDVDYKRDPANVQQRPAIYVKREPVRTGKISWRNMSLPGLNPTTHNFEGTKHSVAIEGSHTIIVVGASGTEADNLAEEVYFRMLHYMSLIRDDFRLGKFFISGIGDIKTLENEAKTAFYATIRCDWAYVYRWLLIPETPILKRLYIKHEEN